MGKFGLIAWNLAPAGQEGRLYLNNRDGTFSLVDDAAMANVFGTESAATWADFDNDGDLIR